MTSYKNFKSVPNVIFGKGSFSQLDATLIPLREDKGVIVFIIDHFFKSSPLPFFNFSPETDLTFFVNTSREPLTNDVDSIVQSIKNQRATSPAAIVAIGGGSTMDMAKAVSVLLTNEGKAENYQGWDLVKTRPIYKIGIPSLSGTGAEVSRTAVLISPQKKQGINSDYSIFNQIILDPNLLETVPLKQAFYTGMDCYIHSVEALCGTFLNEFSKAFAEKALSLCQQSFLNTFNNADLMVASYLGGQSIVYSEVGICHALSYGISYAFKIHHGEANCIVFNYLEDYYPHYVKEFQLMLQKNHIEINKLSPPQYQITDSLLEKMVDITLLMEKPLHNALGPNWRDLLPREKIKQLFLRML
ncbi:MAG: iron-containing alcohol dehydrogenase [Oligoflexia bacterium]|nr:iron-containing alcohol dehydrogenase [Oligoflexia bacterium]